MTRKVQLNVRVTEELAALLPRAMREAQEVLGLPEVSQPDAISMGLKLLLQYLARLREVRPVDIARLTVETPPIPDAPIPEPVAEPLVKRPRGRPKKAATVTPAPAEPATTTEEAAEDVPVEEKPAEESPAEEKPVTKKKPKAK